MFTGRVLDMTSSDLMYKLLEILERKGFILYYLKAYSTTSCYIKLDFGVCNSIRIADHKGIEKYRYTFNLMIGLDKSYEEDGRYYYSVNDFDKMVNDILAYRNKLQEQYGFSYYEKMLENKKQFLRKRKGFWEKARSYND